MSFKSYYFTDIGLKREINEDSILINKEKNLFLLADGMGGYEKGEIASKITVEIFEEEILKNRFLNITNEEHLPKLFQEFIEKITKEIISYSHENKIQSNIGSTLVGIYKNPVIKNLSIFHLGDSRVYRIRNNHIEQLTSDHTLYEEQKKAALLPKEQLDKINKNKLSKAIGNFKAFKLEVSFQELKDNDIFILCSDGIYNFIEENKLSNIILDAKDISFALEEIKTIVYNNGAKDNLSLILTQYNL